MFNFSSTELNVNGNVCEILDEHFEYIHKHRKVLEDKVDSHLEAFRNNNIEEKIKYINDKIGNLSIHTKLREINLDDFMTDFDATSQYTSAMYDEKSVYSGT